MSPKILTLIGFTLVFLISCAASDEKKSTGPNQINPKYSGFSNRQRTIPRSDLDTTGQAVTSSEISIPKTEATSRFIPYDNPPRPVGGYAQIQKNLVYPKTDPADIEGTVMVHVKILSDGTIGDFEILKGIPNYPEMDAAAVEAIMNTQWKPATGQGHPVTVWMSIPVVFRNSAKHNARY